MFPEAQKEEKPTLVEIKSMFTHLHLLCDEERRVCCSSSSVVTWVQMCVQIHCCHMEERAASDREALTACNKDALCHGRQPVKELWVK